MASTHIVKAYDEELQHLNNNIARMGGLAEEQLASAIQSMVKRDSELAKIYGERGQIGWGNAIRSYFLYPEQRVKDARTGELTSNTQGVLDGEIQSFIDAELRRRAAARHK